MFVDAIVAVSVMAASDGGWVSFRFSRVLRPLMLPLVSRMCASTAWSLINTLRRLWDLLVFVFLLCMLLTIVAMALFHGAGLSSHLVATPSAVAATNWTKIVAAGRSKVSMSEKLEHPYDNFAAGLVNVVTLFISADNFPDTLYQAIAGACHQDGVSQALSVSTTACESTQVTLCLGGGWRYCSRILFCGIHLMGSSSGILHNGIQLWDPALGSCCWQVLAGICFCVSLILCSIIFMSLVQAFPGYLMLTTYRLHVYLMRNAYC